MVYENIDLNKIVYIKGGIYKFYEFINNKDIFKEFLGGICLILRFCFIDYYRYYFIDSGVCSISFKISGDYYFVNLIVLSKVLEIFCRNER